MKEDLLESLLKTYWKRPRLLWKAGDRFADLQVLRVEMARLASTKDGTIRWSGRSPRFAIL